MRLSLLDFPDLPLTGFRAALGKNRPATLEKSAGSAPNAPDPSTIAMNQGNYTNPFGGQQTIQSGVNPLTGAPIFQTQVNASPQLQGLLNQQIGQLGGNAAFNQNALGTLGNLQASLNGLYGQAGNLNSQEARQQGQEAYYRQATSMLDPQFAQREASMEAKLAAQGLAPGSQAYSNAIGNFQRDRAFAYDQAQNQAITTGQEMGLRDLAAQQSVLGQQAGFIDQYGNLVGKGVDINQLGYGNLRGLASLIPGYTSPDLSSAFQNQYLGQLGKYNAQQQGRNATLSSLGSLAGGLFNLSGGGGGLGGLFGGGGGLGAAGSALSSVAPGVAAGLGDLFGASIGGTYGAATQAGLDALIGSLGGFSGGGAGAATGAAAGAGAAGGAGGAGGAAAGASGAAGGMGAALGAALPAAIIIGGVLSMFQPGTQPSDISAQWASGLNQSGTSQLNPATFNQFRSEQPALDSLLNLSTVNGQFDFNRYRDALSKSTVGGKHFEGKALDDALLFGRTYANNPQLWGSQAQGTGDWQQRLYADQGGG